MYTFSLDIFSERRQKLIDAIGPDSVAVFVSPSERKRSNDTSYPFRPSSDIVYLSGFEEPNTVLIIAPGSEDGDFSMFVNDRDPLKETWDGRRFGPEGAKNIFGADSAFVIGDFEKKLASYFYKREALYFTKGGNSLDGFILDKLTQLRFGRDGKSGPRLLVDAREIVHDMRLRKSDAEIEVMKQSCNIAAQAHELAMRHTKPGMMEFEIQSVIESHFSKSGASYPAYTSIVGGGDNATILHYIENRSRLNDGDVLLIDAGCEYQYYASDITRSFPVSGKFSAAHRDVYQGILDVEINTIAAAKVGTPYGTIHDTSRDGLIDVLQQLKIFTESKEEIIEKELYKKYYPHRSGHYLGMDVHDVGSYSERDGSWKALQEGVVLTIEPGLYFPANDESLPKEFRGLGIRIEDDIWVRESGPENLTIACPKSVAELESIIGTAG